MVLGREKWTISCCISKQGCQGHQQLQLSSMSQWTLREIRKEKSICPPAASRLQTLPKVSPEERTLRLRKQDTDPRQVRCIWNEWFQWALTHTSSHTQKSTKFLNSGYLVFLTIIFWYSDHLTFLTKFCVTWFLPSPPQSRSYLRWCHLGLKSWKFLLNKIQFSSFRLWIFFKSTGVL